MADKMSALLTDADLRSEIAERGLEYSRHFTWERAARKTIEVYEEATTNR